MRTNRFAICLMPNIQTHLSFDQKSVKVTKRFREAPHVKNIQNVEPLNVSEKMKLNDALIVEDNRHNSSKCQRSVLRILNADIPDRHMPF